MTEALMDTAPAYLENLNPEQLAAVEALDGPVLVLAGAGTGKTRVLTTRIAHLLVERRIPPGQILAVTFTNKAAREMAERVASLTGIMADQRSGPGREGGMWIGTFHSICSRILRRHAEKLGFPTHFTILDADDQVRLVKHLMEELGIDTKNTAPKGVLAIIQGWKDRGLNPHQVDDTGNSAQVAHALRVYHAYQHRLKTVAAMDFGDLLLHCLTLFNQHPDILQYYAQTRFQYVLVDEYQDTNVAQYLWLRLLAMAHKNICCVGDDDQSIYSWRGAEVGNILRFEQDFPNATVIRLERNYRSTSHILGAASQLIANNTKRLGKTLWTDEDGGEKITIKSVWDDAEEARFVGEEIENFQRKGVRASQIAILVRASFQTRAFEERFMTLGIPYRVIGGLRFYERLEIRDALAYMRVLVQPDDQLAFERIINTPKRGVGKATMEQLHRAARDKQISLYRATEQLCQQGEIKGKAGTALAELIHQFDRWRGLLDSPMPFTEVADLVLDEAGYKAMWQQDKTPEAQGRLENIKELLQAMGEYDSLPDFLEHVGLVMDVENTEAEDMVNVMTLHAAKGLEFNTVFLPGWEEGLFPHQRAMDETGQKGLEEERRLAYVGITRARKCLIISHAANRRVYGQWQSSIPSRFLQELPAQHIEAKGGGAYGDMPADRDSWRSEISRIMASARRQGSAESEATTATSTSSSAAYPKGTRIFHQKFGYGRVKSASGQHLEIAFDKAGNKKVMADYVQAVSSQ